MEPIRTQPEKQRPFFPMNRAILWLAAFAVAIPVLWFAGGGALREWRIRRATAAARADLVTGALREASLLARQILAWEPANPEGIALMAQIAEQADSPEAIRWYRRLVEILPADTGARLRLAACALRYGETPIAASALDGVPEAERETAGWLLQASALASASGRAEAASGLMEKALRLAPSDPSLRLNSAALRMLSPDATAARDGRRDMEQLSAEPATRIPALKNLMAHAASRGEKGEAARFAAALGAEPSATLRERLLASDALRETDPAAAAALAAALETLAATTPPLAHDFALHLAEQGEPVRALQWLRTLPPAIREPMPVPLAEAAALAGSKQWAALVSHTTQHASWGALEYLRYAFRSLGVSGIKGDPESPPARDAWQAAITHSAGNRRALAVLAGMAETWGWTARAIEIWRVASLSPLGRREAYGALYRLHIASRDTENLYAVAREILSMEPWNPAAKNNVASLAFTLGRDTDHALRLARELAEEQPENPAFFPVRASALAAEQRIDEAIALLERMPAALAENPEVHLQLGLVYGGAGKMKKARPLLMRALASGRLFPEQEADAVEALGKPDAL